MASTTFNGPVRSEKGFQVATKNTSTGAFTTRMSSGMPDLTGLSISDVATASTLTLAADTISVTTQVQQLQLVLYLQQRLEQLLFTRRLKIQQAELQL